MQSPLRVGTSRGLGLDWTAHFRIDSTRMGNEGPLTEQFVGQELVVANSPREAPRLNYWHREKAQSSTEIDYVISIDRQIIPVEVNAGATGRLRSLQQFAALKRSRFAIRFDVNPPSSVELNLKINTPEGPIEARYHLLSLPSYCASEARRLAAMQLK